jgi:putative FmdB family regulatory protein
MPLYECRCESCDLTFEVLAPLSTSKMKARPCPECGRSARRIISAVSFAVSGRSRARSSSEPRDPSRCDVTKLALPPPARLCWMDDRTAARFAAYKHGRGAEYDDVTAAREEAKKKNGDSQPKPAAKAHSHSPLDDPAVFARRRAAAARKEKVVESMKITGDARSPA